MGKKFNNEFVELEIESLAFEGLAVAKKGGIVYFVKGGLPGEKVSARIIRKKKKHFETIAEDILSASSDRVVPPCSHFGLCGGCSWQHLDYSGQLYWKKRHVSDSLQRIGKLDGFEVLDTIPAPAIFNYRNKMEFSFGTSRWLTTDEIADSSEVQAKNFALGLHIPGRFDKVLDIDKCHIQSDLWSSLLKSVRDKALEFDVKSYNLVSHEGFLRNLIFRRSEANNENMVIFMTTSEKSVNDSLFTDWMKSRMPHEFPDFTHIIHAVNDSFSPVSAGECFHIKGNGFLTEKILDVDFRISPFSFFQTNSLQLNNFINKIIEFAELKKNEILWDLYCGTGSISLPSAGKVKKVIGIELVQSSIEDARQNALLNSIDNAEFFCEDLHSPKINLMLESLPKPDKIIIDPPRAGMHKNLVSFLLQTECPQIVYVSCNPATQARDCELLSEKYLVEKVQPVDMFPQSYHVESVALLRKK